MAHQVILQRNKIQHQAIFEMEVGNRLWLWIS